jgi:DnaK suppressor protein
MNRKIREGATPYLEKLMEKRKEALAGLGLQSGEARVSYDELVLLQPNSPDRAKLQLVDEALDRLHAGYYGSCLACERPIPTKRLQALPWARYCAKCQEQIHGAVEWEANATPPAA